ncbi:aminomethyl-transferring glycine dehydrogenase subunit GcvPA [Bacillaceae bacterium SIJ1]|uniref:aminomethyl-transferring glycine dehydrogenase subunit GcvPA n=1 Tax=Litoribacterium kuwaitense TaxID=1398745 RepID=UPI0013EBAC6B|nr:aminomethyl-transferring glycine dehydrogenase subunit GcvPA [Litoribacterium kuwaitense]NGP43585.1 aminomethyl-transferring glycine dehydrogenase subunit GcvPA [Litoribacterium kuwaitense]
MKHRYLPMTEADQAEMLTALGLEDAESLFASVPTHLRYQIRQSHLAESMSEADVLTYFQNKANENAHTNSYTSFLGAGVYDHYIPTIVDHVISRSEFYTAYTPYQPEMSQGELQAIFEFQTMIAELTGMDLANSSMYDGATAMAEAAQLAASHKRRRKVIVSETVHPESIEVLHTYSGGGNFDVVQVEKKQGVTDLSLLTEVVDNETACVIVQSPNFYGQLEDLEALSNAAKAAGALFVVSANPLSLGVLTPPGDFGADIVVGDVQPFGIPAQYGGPHCGFFAVKKTFMRKIPGRIVGETVDENGQRGYVLTLQTREQHIRRDKATSNICSNHALFALASSVAMSVLGKQGIQEMAEQNIRHAHYAKKAFKEAGVQVVYDGPFFNEFVIDTECLAADVVKKLMDKRILGGFDLGRTSDDEKSHLLVCVTESRKREEIDELVRLVKEVMTHGKTTTTTF